MIQAEQQRRGVRMYNWRLGFTGPTGGGTMRWASYWVQDLTVLFWNKTVTFLVWLAHFGHPYDA